MEHENIIIFIDLLLLRHQVYRHLLFNRTKYLERGISVSHFMESYGYRLTKQSFSQLILKF